jgi:type II secretion system protein N
MGLLGTTSGKGSPKLLRIVGYVALGLVSFVFALQMTFPYGRVKDKVVEALSVKYDVVIGDVERGWMPGKMIFNNVSLKTRPTQPNQIPTLFYIKRLSLDLGVLALLGKKAVVDIEADISKGPLAGVLSGRVSLAKDRVKVTLHSDSLPGGALPLRELVSLPVSGKIAIDADFDLRLVRNTVDWSKAVGHLQLECPAGCVVGDGKTKIRPQVTRPNQAEFVKDGIAFNKLTLDKFLARLEIKKGVAKVTKFDVPSKDGEVHLDFEATLDPILNNSEVVGCLRYNSSEELKQRDYATWLQIKTLGAPLGPDNLFHIRLKGPMREMKRLAQLCGPNVDGKADAGGDAGRRPNPSFNPPDDNRPATPTPEIPAAAPPPVAPPPVAPAPNLPPVTATQPPVIDTAAGIVTPGQPPPPEGTPPPPGGLAPSSPSAPQ